MRKFLGDVKVSEVLDIGAGSGIFSYQLLDYRICESAVCVDPNYQEEKLEIYNGAPIYFIKTIDKIPQKLILMMDVLEHVEDDVTFLKKYVNRIDINSYVLITVPAFQFLWSGHDVFLGHYRRYTNNMIESVVKKAGLTPLKSRYFFGALFLAISVIRFCKKALFNRGLLKAQSELKPYPNWLNSALITLHDIERNTVFNYNKMFGLSIFCLCQKR